MKLTLAEAWNIFRRDVLGEASDEEVRSAKVVFYSGFCAGMAVSAQPGFDAMSALDEVDQVVKAHVNRTKVTIQ